jgi:malate dehydrogenase (oxaloacetate-decarboxylating)
MAYTGVARICEAIHKDPEKAFTLTIKKNTVAVVTVAPPYSVLATLPGGCHAGGREGDVVKEFAGWTPSQFV